MTYTIILESIPGMYNINKLKKEKSYDHINGYRKHFTKCKPYSRLKISTKIRIKGNCLNLT